MTWQTEAPSLPEMRCMTQEVISWQIFLGHFCPIPGSRDTASKSAPVPGIGGLGFVKSGLALEPASWSGCAAGFSTGLRCVPPPGTEGTGTEGSLARAMCGSDWTRSWREQHRPQEGTEQTFTNCGLFRKHKRLQELGGGEQLHPFSSLGQSSRGIMTSGK